MPADFISGLRRRLAVAVGRSRAGRRTNVATARSGHLHAQHPLHDLPVAVLDTETTGLDVRRDRILSIGAFHADGGHLHELGPLDLFVNPGRPIPPASTRIHGITDAMVAAAPQFALMWPAVHTFWQDRVLVGHNIAFDLALFRSETERARLPFHPPAAALDIGLLYAGLKPRSQTYTLEAIARDYDVTAESRHSALGDALTTARLWAHLVTALAAHGIGTLGQAQALMRRQRDIVFNQARVGWATEFLVPHE